ncbi:LysE family translocator [Devosia sp. XJ19-1]|uniref:LysE family translocator n=1 Tax=Devosia ureilytica TaxID=2952754 RepID=A0A9Q4ALE8_9HYPH|nr:LysE family translocator [Devosia ureilytica]MCP8882037.1 LysE family translocator [Devosia ureilytica]MCP8886077.1 LysE family translocator [Devosia ureilytica]
MDYTQALWLYTFLVFGIIVVPGMDMFYVLANALTGGRGLAAPALSGIMLGGAVHTLFGALAVGVLAQLPVQLFQVMVLAGALYMAWIGYTLLRSAIVVDHVSGSRIRSGWVAFRQGTITCLLNPKAYLFVLAVFPQFMRPEYGPVWSQALILGVITVLMQGSIYGALALGASRTRDALVDNPAATIWIGRGAGALFMAVALFTAWHGLTMTSVT